MQLFLRLGVSLLEAKPLGGICRMPPCKPSDVAFRAWKKQLRMSLNMFPWGSRHQVGIYDPGPVLEVHVRDLKKELGRSDLSTLAARARDPDGRPNRLPPLRRGRMARAAVKTRSFLS